MRRAELDADGSLLTGGGARVSRLELSAEMIVNRTTVIYGPSGSGKTVIAKNLLGAVQGLVPQALVVSPSEPSNQSYKGFIDAPFIHYALALPLPPGAKKETQKQAALRFLNEIWKRQELMSSIYKRANDPAVLSALFGRTPRAARAEGLAALTEAQRVRLEVRDKLRRRFAAEPGRAADKAKEVDEKFAKMLVLIYKKTITPHYAALWGLDDLSEAERFSLNYLHFNPNLLLLFDDCAADLKALLSTNEFKRFFYQGRHVHVTTVLIVQDDTDLPTNLRKNAFLSIFTDPIVCRSNFDRGSNNFPKPTKAFVGEVIPDVFVGNRKLVYIRDDPRGKNFYHLEVPYPSAFRFGSPAAHDLCDAVRARGATLDTENPFYRRFQVAA